MSLERDVQMLEAERNRLRDRLWEVTNVAANLADAAKDLVDQIESIRRKADELSRLAGRDN